MKGINADVWGFNIRNMLKSDIFSPTLPQLRITHLPLLVDGLLFCLRSYTDDTHEVHITGEPSIIFQRSSRVDGVL